MTIRPAASASEDDDPVGERQPVAAQGELARHVPVPARIASSRGKALKLVLAARNSSSAVKAWNR